MAIPQPLPDPTPYESESVDMSDRLTGHIESRPLFIWAHFWQAWHYCETTDAGVPVDGEFHGLGKGTGEWLPAVTKIAIMKGSGGAATDRDIQAGVRRAVDKGGTVFLPGDRRLGRWSKYQIPYKDMRGGLHFAEPFERATRLPSGQIRFEQRDPADERAFRRHLRDHAVEPMSPQAYADIRQRRLTEVERLREAGKPSALERADRLLAAWDAAWERELARQRTDAPAEELAPAMDLDLGAELTAAEQAIATTQPRRRRA